MPCVMPLTRLIERTASRTREASTLGSRLPATFIRLHRSCGQAATQGSSVAANNGRRTGRVSRVRLALVRFECVLGAEHYGGVHLKHSAEFRIIDLNEP